jgi:hypothetical protein
MGLQVVDHLVGKQLFSREMHLHWALEVILAEVSGFPRDGVGFML